MFMMALQKMGLQPSDVCMIGDSFNKDIFGAVNLNIQSIWINHDNKQEDTSSPLIKEVNRVNEIIELI
jgi:putative hydrolase of the HAD superfamily